MAVKVTIIINHVGKNQIDFETTMELSKNSTCVHELEAAEELKGNLDTYFKSFCEKETSIKSNGENSNVH
jgi:hypothetical protein